MTEIRSRVTNEHLIRKGIFAAMIVGFTIAFGYDGYVRYPQKNVEEGKKTLLDPVPEENPPINPRITSESTRWVKEENVKRLQTIIDRFGEPSWQHQSDLRTTHVYFGPAYVLKLTTVSGVIQDVDRDVERIPAAYKTEGELKIQKGFLLVLGIISFPVALHYLRVLVYRVRLSDRGLKLSGKPLVPFEAMTSMNADRYKDKGWLEIGYRLDETEGMLRLDDYWIRAFEPIVTEICRRTGFDNPLVQEGASDQAETSPPPTANQSAVEDETSDS